MPRITIWKLELPLCCASIFACHGARQFLVFYKLIAWGLPWQYLTVRFPSNWLMLAGTSNLIFLLCKLSHTRCFHIVCTVQKGLLSEHQKTFCRRCVSTQKSKILVGLHIGTLVPPPRALFPQFSVKY